MNRVQRLNRRAMVCALCTSLALIAVLAIGACQQGGGGGTTNANGQVNANGQANDNGAPQTGFTLGGLQPPASEIQAHPQSINPYAATSSQELPTSVDLSKDLPGIGDQGRLGSCTAWASAYAGATYTANRQYEWGADSTGHQASPGYMYARLLEEHQFECGSGTSISLALELLKQEGCSSLATVTYRDDVCEENPSASDAANFQLGSTYRVDHTSQNAVKGELAAGRIVVFGANLYDDFFDASGSGVYTGSGVLMQQGEQHAAHAMSLVGYDDSLGAYRIMNSWGTAWGDSGFLWMAYSTFEALAFEAYSLEPSGDRDPPDPDPGPGPEPTPPVDDPDGYLDDAFQFADADPLTGAQVVYLVFFWHFSSPVQIHTVSVTDPLGATGQQDWNSEWYLDGYVYFTQTGGFSWQAGTYHLEFDTTTAAGNNVLYYGDTDVAALDGTEPIGDDEICDNYCDFAFDGECDDGGSGADWDVCEFGSDCWDCGVRSLDDLDGGDGGTGICYDYCEWAGDGECDDGGPGALWFVCDYGSDCTDCGVRDFGDGSFKQATHVFRGIPVENPPNASQMPPAGVRPSTLGANGKPVTIIEKQ
jgi:hypothetical protein